MSKRKRKRKLDRRVRGARGAWPVKFETFCGSESEIVVVESWDFRIALSALESVVLTLTDVIGNREWSGIVAHLEALDVQAACAWCYRLRSYLLEGLFPFPFTSADFWSAVVQLSLLTGPVWSDVFETDSGLECELTLREFALLEIDVCLELESELARGAVQ